MVYKSLINQIERPPFISDSYIELANTDTFAVKSKLQNVVTEQIDNVNCH